MTHKLLFFIAMILCPLFASAQKLKAVSISYMPGASVAQQRNVLDKKGRLCACVTVSCPAPEFKISGRIERQDPPAHGRIRAFVPHGTRWIEVQAPGYAPLKVRFKDINHNILGVESEADYNLVIEISDEKDPEYKPTGLSLGGSYTIGSLPGAAIHLSGSYHRVELELGYRFGTQYSGTANWYQSEGTNTVFTGSTQYRLDALQAKLGYIITPHNRLAVVPQAGYALHMLHGKTVEGSEIPGTSSKLACMTLGAKLVFSPLSHISLFAAPEYDIPLGKSDIYSRVAKAAGFTAGGFYCPIGVLFHF